MDLTEVIALQITEDLWNWLAMNPGRAKSDYPGWEANGGTILEMRHSCPCCEYAANRLMGSLRKPEVAIVPTDIGEAFCEHCPLAGFWPPNGCTSYDSPFALWANANPESRFWPLLRSGYATMIANAAKQERERLENKEGE